MDGYVIVLQNDEGNDPPTYWAGDATTSNLDNVTFFTDIVAARQSAGNLQTQYTDRTVSIAPATKGITLNTPPATLTNVATGI